MIISALLFVENFTLLTTPGPSFNPLQEHKTRWIQSGQIKQNLQDFLRNIRQNNRTDEEKSTGSQR